MSSWFFFSPVLEGFSPPGFARTCWNEITANGAIIADLATDGKKCPGAPFKKCSFLLFLTRGVPPLVPVMKSDEHIFTPILCDLKLSCCCFNSNFSCVGTVEANALRLGFDQKKNLI